MKNGIQKKQFVCNSFMFNKENARNKKVSVSPIFYNLLKKRFKKSQWYFYCLLIILLCDCFL